MMKRLKYALGLLAAIALGACGRVTKLEPEVGETMPPAPLGAKTEPSADDLLKSEPQAAPNRNIELRYRSEERSDDPFDLPPPETVESK